MGKENVIKKDDIKKYIEEFINQCKGHGRFLSWWWCYQAFGEFFSKEKEGDKTTVSEPDKQQKDYLALQLGFYLASWGMYRGSSFLLQHDYKFHKDIVEIVLDSKYAALRGIQVKKYQGAGFNKYRELLADVFCRIRRKYIELLKDENPKLNADTAFAGVDDGGEENATDTLITKILMGTLGCIPAYDRFFKTTFRHTLPRQGADLCKKRQDDKKITKNIDKSIRNLSESKTCEKIVALLTQANSLSAKVFGSANILYPECKLIDMVFWQADFRMFVAEKEQKHGAVGKLESIADDYYQGLIKEYL